MLIETKGVFETAQSLCLVSEVSEDCVPLIVCLFSAPQT